MKFKITKSFFTYLIELVVAIVLLNIRFEAFIIYAVFLIVLKINLAINYLRKINSVSDYLQKLIRVFQVFNQEKLAVIMKKLNISEEESQKIIDEERNSLPDEQRESLYKDMNDLGLQ
jgi:hypothetical protein